MGRRRFFKLMTLATTGAIAPLEAMAAGAAKTVTYRVKGFSCVTCATGLDTTLRQQKGIISSQSIYPEGTAKVGFDPAQITEEAIAAFITELGFTVAAEHRGCIP